MLMLIYNLIFYIIIYWIIVEYYYSNELLLSLKTPLDKIKKIKNIIINPLFNDNNDKEVVIKKIKTSISKVLKEYE